MIPTLAKAVVEISPPIVKEGTKKVLKETPFVKLKETGSVALNKPQLVKIEIFYKLLPEPIQQCIRNKNELLVYNNAGLRPATINKKFSLIKTDSYIYSHDNMLRMNKGKAPLDLTGKPLNLHHIGQNADSPLAQLTQAEHQSNSGILHESNMDSRIDRKAFMAERRANWKAIASLRDNHDSSTNI